VVVSDKGGNGIAEGSGFLVSRDGKLVTNYHVIENAASAIVKFPNGAFYAVQGVLGTDKVKDLAVLKLSGTDFPFLPLGDSGKVQVGETVVAIGNPLALEATVSNGIVSAVRELEGEDRLRVIQTTAPISPGSSGGVLLNLKGEVVGVTTFHLVSGQNLNFAVPADYIRPLLAFKIVNPFAPDNGRAEPNSANAAESSARDVASSSGADAEKGYETCDCASYSSVLLFSSATSDNVVDHLYCGEEVSIISRETRSNNPRLKVRSDKDAEGYISPNFVCKRIEIPKDWISLESGTPMTVRKDGDHIYEMGEAPGDGRYSKEIRTICDTKRQGSEWVGTCRYRILLVWESAVTENWCSLELGERITSISPRRIEGMTQKFERATNIQNCPTPGSGWEPWAYIPKD
jgi:hypothetical protein